MTGKLMRTLTPQLRKIAITERTSHSSLIREPDVDFRILVDKLKHVGITMKFEENSKLKYVNNVQTTIPQTNNTQDSVNHLTEKTIQILNIYEKNTKFKDKSSFTKWRHSCRRYGQIIAEC